VVVIDVVEAEHRERETGLSWSMSSCLNSVPDIGRIEANSG
jgi:hypothetical protein